jgi:hypothetical protein
MNNMPVETVGASVPVDGVMGLERLGCAYASVKRVRGRESPSGSPMIGMLPHSRTAGTAGHLRLATDINGFLLLWNGGSLSGTQ